MNENCMIPNLFLFQLTPKYGNDEIKRRKLLVKEIIMKRQKPEFYVLTIIN